MSLFRPIIAALAAAAALAATAALPYPTVAQMGGNNYAYPWLDSVPAQTPAPEGYKPFHIEHYGRHGSRYHIGDYQYETPIKNLEKAEKAGVLTPLGQQTLDSARVYKANAYKRDGELSDIGALQHQAIARRMAANFPEIFSTPGTHVDAKSTVVIRCILSMLNEVKELQAAYPGLLITTDASNADMWYMNNSWGDSVMAAVRDSVTHSLIRPWQRTLDNDGSLYLPLLVSDAQFAADSIDAAALASSMIQLFQMTQSHSAEDASELLAEIFTPGEIYNEWLKGNANWYKNMGRAGFTGINPGLEQSFLLDIMIAAADTAVVSSGTSANLRFGHDTIVLPLAVLMELDDAAVSVDNPDEIAAVWRDYMLIPMAANIQMIFYRPEGSVSPDDVIVKVLLNEHEATLPIKTDSAPYYKWTDVRSYYKGIIDPYISTHTPRR